MRHLKRVWSLLTYHWRELVLFELVYKVICYSVAVPLVRLSINGLIWATGFRYITKANFIRFLLHPATITAALIVFFLMTFFSLLDISTVIYILDRAYQRKGVSVLEAVRFSFRNTKKIFRPGCIALVGYVLFMIPFIHLGLSSGMITSIVRPEYIMERVHSNPLFFILMYAGMAVILFFLVRWLYLFHYFTLEDQNFHDSKVCSIRLVKPHWFTDLLVLIGLEAVLYLFYRLMALVGVAVIALFGNIGPDHSLAGSVIYSTVIVFLGVLAIVFLSMAFPFIYSVISVLYYTHKESAGEEVLHPPAPDIPKKPIRRRFVVISLAAFAGAVTLCSFYIYGLSRGKYSLAIEDLHTVQVTAHRGASELYPENTMAAFRGAYEQGADWIELDVQQLKDGAVIICHDKNVKRVSGVNKNVWELTLPEVKSLDVGKKFGPEFEGERIPLLSEAVEYARAVGIRLDIEIKPTGHETNLEEVVAQVIRDNLFQSECVISSFNYDSLKKIKHIDPTIQTVYITDVAAGHIEELVMADAYAIEPTFVTEAMIDTLHNRGKELWVWTVNNKANATRMIRHGVDNIITDRVSMVKECVNAERSGNLVTRVVDQISALFH